MVEVIRRRTPQPGESRTVCFEGRDHGTEVSFFLIDYAPGQSVGLHRHPYAETWIVRAGEAEFAVGDERLRARAGDIVVAPAEVPHRFLNVGSDRLELVCIHPRDHVEQAWVEEGRAERT